MKKRIILTLTAVLLLVFLSGCTESIPVVEEEIDGGWMLASDWDSPDMPTDVEKAFNEKTAKVTTGKLRPVAYLAKRRNNGYDYLVLSRFTSVKEDEPDCYKMVVFSKELGGLTWLRAVSPFNLSEYESEKDTDIRTPDQSYSWEPADDYCGQDIPKQVRKAFEKAYEGSEDMPEPVAFLASKSLEGYRHMFICKGKDEQGDEGFYVVTVQQSPGGDCSIHNEYSLKLFYYGGGVIR